MAQDRVVAQLLAEIDGMHAGGGSEGSQASDGVSTSSQDIFVIGATNRCVLLKLAVQASAMTLAAACLLSKTLS